MDKISSTHVVISFLVLLLLGFSSSQDCPYTPFQITQTFGFQERFLGNCFEIAEKEKLAVSSDFCSSYWTNFSNVYDDRLNSDIVPGDYYPVIQTVQNQVNRFFNFSSTLFWSGAKDEKGQLSESVGYLTLEGTLVGYTSDSLNWCGNNTNTCNYEENVPWNSRGAGASFWGSASTWFARMAQGEVSVLLMARTPCDFNRSIFANIEVNQFQRGQVTNMIIYLLKKEGIADQCHPPAGNIITLNQKIENNLGFVPQCEDDNEFVLGILCSHPENVEKDFCQEILKEYKTVKLTPAGAGLAFGFSILGAILLGALVTFLYFRYRTPRRSNGLSEPLLS